MEYLMNNYEWIFSGIGVLILGWIGTYVYNRYYKSKSQNNLPEFD